MNTKKTYKNVEELAADLDFIHWVKDPVSENLGHWHAALEQQDDLIWIEEAKSLVMAIGFSSDKSDAVSVERMWTQIDNATQNAPFAFKIISFRSLSIAASICLFLSSFWWFAIRNPLETTQTGLAEVKEMELPDGSQVNINAESSISFSERTWDEKRVIILQGEAFFKVAKGERFTVESSSGLVEVLGTSFNVLDREGRFVVVCHTGKVRVTSANQTVLLEKGQSATLKGVQLKKSKVQVDPDKTWMKGYFVFSDTKLDQVLAELERQFAVAIDRSTINSQKTYTGFFIKNNLSEALQAVCWPMRLKFDIQGTEVKISEEK